MEIRKVGILSPGDMGHAVGRVLVDKGMTVITCLEGRSERTKALSHKAGIKEASTYAELLREVDMVLSILVPSQAFNAAAKVARTIDECQKIRHLCRLQCRLSGDKKQIGLIITETGSPFVDAGIIGPPPGRRGTTKFYASGPQLDEFGSLVAYGLDIRVVGAEIGQASGLKMSYAALTKGLTAISTGLLVAARQMGLFESLVAELKESQNGLYAVMERSLPTMVYRARRWIGEMEEIAATFSEAGLTPKLYEGAADIYRLVSETSLADETPETFAADRTLAQTVDIIAQAAAYHVKNTF